LEAPASVEQSKKMLKIDVSHTSIQQSHSKRGHYRGNVIERDLFLLLLLLLLVLLVKGEEYASMSVATSNDDNNTNVPMRNQKSQSRCPRAHRLGP
jgi:hypothetical protein